jgi:hypothetical protein
MSLLCKPWHYRAWCNHSLFIVLNCWSIVSELIERSGRNLLFLQKSWAVQFCAHWQYTGLWLWGNENENGGTAWQFSEYCCLFLWLFAYAFAFNVTALSVWLVWSASVCSPTYIPVVYGQTVSFHQESFCEGGSHMSCFSHIWIVYIYFSTSPRRNICDTLCFQITFTVSLQTKLCLE